ncbi:MAG: phosphohydrolase [Chloroflexi bacterium]|nr:MAG: phosphohydrolase [Chloroflexota bacterium]
MKNPLSDDKYLERTEKREEDARGPYFRDQTAIVHSFPFRRLKHKAQVFFSPNNDHVCTRIEHALHVASIAATICKGLGLNPEIAYAIGLAHDLGHAPFGHAGETVLAKESEDVGGFIHEAHGLRVVEKLGNRGETLNLTYVVRDGIVCHCGEKLDQELEPRDNAFDLSTINKKGVIPCSQEGCIVRLSDRVAYLGRDLEDAIYGKFIKNEEIPSDIEKELGQTNGEIINTLVTDIIETSKRNGKIGLSDERFELVKKLYDFSINKIYNHETIVRYQCYCRRIIEQLFEYLITLYNNWNNDYMKYSSSPLPLDKRFGEYLERMKKLYESEKASAKMIVRDYIAGMTDGYALRCMKEISLPKELSFD